MTWWDEHKRRAQARTTPEYEPDESSDEYAEEFDQLDQLDDDQLDDEQADIDYDAELAAIDARIAAGVDDQEGNEQGMGNLTQWEQRVEEFGGRAGSPQRGPIQKQISQGQLGQIVLLDTINPNPVFPAAILLAEVSLDKAIPLDITFSYHNRRTPRGEPAGRFLDPGDGFVRLTWGTPGTFPHVAEIDGGHGWRKEFSASFMRVEYIPIDPTGNQPMIGGQARDLGVGATITPGVGGGTRATLTRTVTMTNMGINEIRIERIPDFAEDYTVAGNFIADNGMWSIEFSSGGDPVGKAFANMGAGQWPIYQGSTFSRKVPQRAGAFRFVTIGNGSDIDEPSVIFGLAL